MSKSKKFCKSIIAAFMMVLMISVSFMPIADAAENKNASNRLSAIMKQSGFKVNSATSLNCFEFATKVSNALYGTSIGRINLCKYTISTSTYDKVSTLSGRSASKSAVSNMLQKAYPGDIIQFRGPLTAQHTAVIESVGKNGVTLYHSRTSGGRYYIRKDYITWSEMYSYWSGDFTYSSSYGISLYHSEKYDDKFKSCVKLSKTTEVLPVGDEVKLTASVTNSNNKKVSWKSSNNKVATVKNGKIKAVGKGTATITAESCDGTKAKCTLKVIKISIPELKMNKIPLSY